MRNNYLFTSESVTEGHPDKIADQISDGILDAIIAQDKYSRVACETILTTGIAFVAGEISTKAYVEIPDIIREVIKDVGYCDASWGFDFHTCSVLTVDPPAIGRHRHGRGFGRRRRPGPDVRLCDQRDDRTHADADRPRASAHAAGWRKCARKTSFPGSVPTANRR